MQGTTGAAQMGGGHASVGVGVATAAGYRASEPQQCIPCPGWGAAGPHPTHRPALPPSHPPPPAPTPPHPPTPPTPPTPKACDRQHPATCNLNIAVAGFSQHVSTWAAHADGYIAAVVSRTGVNRRGACSHTTTWAHQTAPALPCTPSYNRPIHRQRTWVILIDWRYDHDVLIHTDGL